MASSGQTDNGASAAAAAPAAQPAQVDLSAGRLAITGRVRDKTPDPDEAPTGIPATIDLSDVELGGKPGLYYPGIEPVPLGVDARYWYRLYNRANSQLKHHLGKAHRGQGSALSKDARAAGITRQLAYEKLARDVADSLVGDRDKKVHLRVASRTWTPDTNIVQALARRGIQLVRSDWPGADQMGSSIRWPAEERFGFHWKTNVFVKR